MNEKIEMNKKYDEIVEIINNNKMNENKEFDIQLLIKENEINKKIKDLIKEDITIINNKINEKEENINKKRNKLNEDINNINNKINEINNLLLYN